MSTMAFSAIDTFLLVYVQEHGHEAKRNNFGEAYTRASIGAHHLPAIKVWAVINNRVVVGMLKATRDPETFGIYGSDIASFTSQFYSSIISYSSSKISVSEKHRPNMLTASFQAKRIHLYKGG